MGLKNWTDTIFHDSHDFHQGDLLHSDKQIRVFTSVFSNIMSRVMTEKVEQDFLLITDLRQDHIFLRTFQQNMFDLNYHIDIQYITHIDSHNVDSVVLEMVTQSLSIALLILPWEISELVLKAANRNLLLTNEKRLTWIVFNGKQIEDHHQCIHNVGLNDLMQATYIDHYSTW